MFIICNSEKKLSTETDQNLGLKLLWTLMKYSKAKTLFSSTFSKIIQNYVFKYSKNIQQILLLTITWESYGISKMEKLR